MIFKHADDIYKETAEEALVIYDKYLKRMRKTCVEKIDEAKSIGSYYTNIDLYDRHIYKILKAELKDFGYKVSRLKGDSWCNKYFTISWDKRKKEML